LISKKAWVQITKVILKPEERFQTLPLDTLKCPLTMWVKGFLLEDANLGDFVSIQTITGRTETGTLICENPAYHHDFGDFVPELLQIDHMVKTKLDGEHHD